MLRIHVFSIFTIKTFRTPVKLPISVYDSCMTMADVTRHLDA